MLCIYYCAPDMKYIDEAPQIKIDYRPQDETLEEFIKIHADQTIYIDTDKIDLFSDGSYLRTLQSLKKYNNWVLQIPIALIKENQIKFDAIKDCCNRYMFTDLIGNWEVLQYVLTLNPCEVYVTNMLAWDLFKVTQLCSIKGVGVRAYANIAQCAWDNAPDLTKFFIRPEDLNVYEPYLSGIEFAGDGKNIQEVMYEVYTDGYWYGDLGEIILNFNSHVDSRCLPAEFGEWRFSCGKRCIKGAGCGLCERAVEFSDTLQKINLQVIPPSKRKE